MPIEVEGNMINHATAIYTIIDDVLKAVGHQEDPRRKVTDVGD